MGFLLVSATLGFGERRRSRIVWWSQCEHEGLYEREARGSEEGEGGITKAGVLTRAGIEDATELPEDGGRGRGPREAGDSGSWKRSPNGFSP